MALPNPDINILVVDDMAAMRKILKTLLAQLGYKNVDEAEDGKQALEKLRQNPDKYGLVITDWNMPNMTGIEPFTAETLKEKLEAIFSSLNK